VVVAPALTTLAAIVVAVGFVFVLALRVAVAGPLALVIVAASLAAGTIAVHQTLAALAVLQVAGRLGDRAVASGGALGALAPGRQAHGFTVTAVVVADAAEALPTVAVAQGRIARAIPVIAAGVLALVVAGKTCEGAAAVAVFAARLAATEHTRLAAAIAVGIGQALDTSQLLAATEITLFPPTAADGAPSVVRAGGEEQHGEDQG